MDKCTNCGNCCTPCLQVTQEEYETIKQYIIDNNIQEQLYYKEGRLEFICPFRDVENSKCNIYEVKPRVCTLFECWTEGYNLTDAVQEIIDTAIEGDCNANRIFFNNTTFLDEYRNK